MKPEGFFVKYQETAQSQPSTRPIRRLEMVGDVAQSLASELAQIRIIEIVSILVHLGVYFFIHVDTIFIYTFLFI